ncbi:MAG: lipopolysaccharide heptosyltransferase II [Deltaproteobacteria bacterium]|nr:lipopolysaccharide heptosyltransferase II [Deltaproteobacteria bacterium]MBI3387309.1 lipopolysaccharide heptosyltransferase II [Deltaproteobacteria bacterium]
MRIVVAQTSFLGDVVLSTPVFAALKRRWPESHLTAWLRPEAAAVLAGHPHVDAVLVDDKRGADRGLRGLMRLRARLRAERFDLAVALHKSLRTAVLLALAGVPRRVGFRQSAGWFLYPERVNRDPTCHDVERNLSIVSALGIDPKQGSPRLLVVPTSSACDRVAALLREANVGEQQPLVGIAPGSTWATKRWTVEGYAEAVRSLAAEGYGVLLFGAPNEGGIADRVNQMAGGVALNLVGRTDVGMLVAAIDRVQVLLCNDSAPMHIAVARDIPVVAVFGPTHPQQGYGPYSVRATVVQRDDLDCRPCGRHGAAVCPIATHACMVGINAATVLAAARRLLDARVVARPHLVAP